MAPVTHLRPASIDQRDPKRTSPHRLMARPHRRITPAPSQQTGHHPPSEKIRGMGLSATIDNRAKHDQTLVDSKPPIRLIPTSQTRGAYANNRRLVQRVRVESHIEYGRPERSPPD